MEFLRGNNIELDRQRVLDSIKKVGPDKPVGYLPVDSITNYCGVDPEDLITSSEEKGLKIKIFEGETWPGGKALYVYDKTALQCLLDENKDTLIFEGWPTDADQFVENLDFQVPIGTPMYKLIAKAFGDKFSEQLEP